MKIKIWRITIGYNKKFEYDYPFYKWKFGNRLGLFIVYRLSEEEYINNLK